MIARFGFQVSQLATEVQSLRSRLAEVETQRLELERRLAAAHDREDELVRAAAQLQEARRQEIEAAHRDAQEIVAAAELAAAQIRADADLQAEVARAQADQVMRLRESFSETVRLAVHDLQSVLRQVESGTSATSATPPPLGATHLADLIEPSESDVFDGRVELRAGPFNDFASLSAFEQALGSLPKIDDVYIRRFEGEQATIDLTLLEPSTLIDELADRMPYSLDIERSGLDHIAVTVTGAR
jgi:hypothetical protein